MSGIFIHPKTGNVGIGLTNPRSALEVNGTITASNISVIGDFVRLNTVTSNTEQMVIENAGTGPALKVTQTGANSIAEFYDDGGVLALKIADGGNIGIGTGIPMAQLHVNGTGAMILPSGTTAQIPSIAIVGMLRYNTDLNKLQYYNPIGWTTIGAVSAVGGNLIFDANGYRIHVFTNNGTFTVYSGGPIECLIVAGGGGGGGSEYSNHNGGGGGGGGAGGLIYMALSLNANSYSIVVGLGGTGGALGNNSGSKGQDSSAFNQTALGGGGGVGEELAPAAINNGGSGGGGGGDYQVAGSGTPGQGTNGGTRGGTRGGGGGGGASVSGSASGGNGTGFTIFSATGTLTYYGGGGGGGGGSQLAGTAGGLGGGGTGGNCSTNINGGTISGGNGAANTGGGGGGTGAGNSTSGGNGGSGIVMIRYIL